MKIREIKELQTTDIIKRIGEEEKNLLDLRFSHALKQLTNTAKLNTIKKDVAKMKTIVRQKALAK
ncbi:MAG: 50S ribosomal protein L29 [Ignavibacteria bacterium]